MALRTLRVRVIRVRIPASRLMYQVYILQSLKDKRTYVGFSEDTRERLKEHNAGKVKATKNRRPLVILIIEGCETMAEAKKRELYWKSGGGRRKLKEYFIKGFPPVRPAGARRSEARPK